MPTPRFRLHLFGTPALYSAEGSELRSVTLQPKRLALLAFLAANPRGIHRRDTLLGLFWPDLDTEHARGALSKALHYLRRSLGDAVLVTSGHDELRLDDTRLWCDVAAFEGALEQGRGAEALKLYRGHLLNGFFLSDSPAFERWLEAERERLRRRAASAGSALAEAAAAGGDLVEAIEWALWAQVLSEDEIGLRHLITLLERAGDRARAVRVYEEFGRRLSREFEVEPSPETQALIARVRGVPSLHADAGEENRDHPAFPDAATIADAAADRGVAAGRQIGDGRRARGRRRAAQAAFAAAALALAVFSLSYVVASRDTVAALDPQRVVVAPFVNRTGQPALDPIGSMAADWIIQGLAQTAMVDVVPLSAALSSAHFLAGIIDATDSAERIQALGRETGAGIVISGSYYLQDDSLYIQAKISNASAGMVLEALEPVSAPPAVPLPAVEALRQRVLAGLAPHIDPRMRDHARIIGRTASYEPYREYAQGMERYVVDQDWRGALEQFSRATAYDSAFTLPLVRSAIIYVQTNNHAAADSVARLLEPRMDGLPEFDRQVITAVAGWARGDYTTSYRALARAAQLAPNTIPHYQLAQKLLILNRPREALRVLEELDPHRGELRGWFMYWIRLTETHHRLGDYRRELQVARRAREHFPEHANALRLELRALIALGRVAEALRSLDDHLATSDDGQRGDLLRHTALELHAHGHADAARQLFDRSMDWYVARPGLPTRTLGEACYRVGRWDDAERILLGVAARRPNDVHVVGLLGAVAARRGDRAEAERISTALAELERPYLLGENTYWRARIAALLGEREQAVALLRAAFAEGKMHWLQVHYEPDLESLRDYPPFRELLRPKG